MLFGIVTGAFNAFDLVTKNIRNSRLFSLPVLECTGQVELVF